MDDDFYVVVFKLVSGNVCDNEKKRDFCKKFFLPIIYGASAKTLSRELEVSQSTAESIVDRVYKLFPTSFKWIQERQNEVDVVAMDYFGRKRCFDESKHWKVRDFVVQSPASLVCLEKLIALHNKIKGYARLACHIHDGYILYVNKSFVKMIAGMAKEILEQESELCPGLKLRSSCKVGRSLSELSVLKE